jgi:hypothetical protein
VTIDPERWQAIERTRTFLERMMDPRETPRIPLDYRREARSLLKHFPERWWLEQLREKDET